MKLFLQIIIIIIIPGAELPLTPNLLTTTIVAPPSNGSKWQMGFNSALKGLIAERFGLLNDLLLPFLLIMDAGYPVF